MLKGMPFFKFLDNGTFSNTMELCNCVAAGESMGNQNMWHNVSIPFNRGLNIDGRPLGTGCFHDYGTIDVLLVAEMHQQNEDISVIANDFDAVSSFLGFRELQYQVHHRYISFWSGFSGDIHYRPFIILVPGILRFVLKH